MRADLPERHGEIAVQRLDRRAVQKRRLVDEILAEIQAEEIAHRSFDAGLGIAVPVDAEHDFLQVIRALRGDREPDVRDDAGPGGVEDFLRLARRDRPAVVSCRRYGRSWIASAICNSAPGHNATEMDSRLRLAAAVPELRMAMLRRPKARRIPRCGV